MSTDRRTFMKASAALLAAAAATGRVHGSQASLRDTADALLRNGAESGDVPGVVAMATNRSDVLYEGAFGKPVLGQPATMQVDTVVWIASMTKSITSAAAMQMVERGELALDVPATRYVPDLSAALVLDGWDEKGQPRMRAPRRAITLRHLLTHTAGFAYDLWSTDVGRYCELRGIPGIITCQNAALRTPLLFDPGERWEYGINIDWAGKMVEAVSGQRLGQYVEENITGPLGMTNTAFRITPDMRARMAKIHMRNENGQFAPTDIEIPQDPEFEMGGGGMYSTAGDYLKFVRMILNRGTGNGNRILRADTVDLMSRPAMGDTKVTMLKTAMPALTNDAEFFPGLRKTWALAYMINEEPAPTGRPAGSLAWAGLANTYFWIDPSNGVGGVYLTQVLPFADAKALPLFYAFEQSVYQSLS